MNGSRFEVTNNAGKLPDFFITISLTPTSELPTKAVSFGHLQVANRWPIAKHFRPGIVETMPTVCRVDETGQEQTLVALIACGVINEGLQHEQSFVCAGDGSPRALET
jgi:hypothetical protein